MEHIRIRRQVLSIRYLVFGTGFIPQRALDIRGKIL